MTEATATQSTVSRSFWIIGGLALLWNLIGVASYIMNVTMSEEALAAMPEAEQALYTSVPTLVTSAFAIAVFAGLLGCVLLLMRKSLAYPLFIVSLVAIVIQAGYNLFLSSALEVLGATAAILPILIVTVAVYLVWFSSNAKKKGILS